MNMNTHTVPVQTGPLYACFTCGVPMQLDRSFADLGSRFLMAGYSPVAMDEWGQHVWYLRKLCVCEPRRVVRLGDCIAPLNVREPKRGLADVDIPQIREALAAIARAVKPEDRKCDPAARVVYLLLAGQMAPDSAIAEIRCITASALTT